MTCDAAQPRSQGDEGFLRVAGWSTRWFNGSERLDTSRFAADDRSPQVSVPPQTPPPLIPQHQRDTASLETVDLGWIQKNFPRYEDGKPFTESDAMYAAFTWSEAKHDGRGPAGQEPPGADIHAFELVGTPFGVQYRVYLNTTADATQTVAEWLRGSKVVHKRGAPGWAAHRRDAIIVYISGQGKPSLQEMLNALADYQATNLAHFVDERVRLTRPAVGQRAGQPVTLVGVGIADEVQDTSKSFSEVAADAVLRARTATEHDLQKGPGAFQRHLAEAFEQAGRSPLDPSKEHYLLSVGGRSVVIGDRHVTAAQILSAAGVDSERHDLYSGLRRFTAGDLIFVRRGDKFGVVEKGAPTPSLKPPNLQKT